MHFILKAYFYMIEINFFKQIMLCIKSTKISKIKFLNLYLKNNVISFYSILLKFGHRIVYY